ncbi:baseplate protein, partial [Vibrio aestuarianus]|nr:baseplate protein [Vibrio aestuarianus]
MFNKLADIKAKLSDVLSMLRKLVCIGEVSKVDAQLRRVKVTFPGLPYPESDWLPVLGIRSKSVSISCNLEAGEQVLCLFIPSGSMMSGYVLGSMANKSAKPYAANVDKFGVRFKDGTILEYDQSTQTGVLKIGGGTPA